MKNISRRECLKLTAVPLFCSLMGASGSQAAQDRTKEQDACSALTGRGTNMEKAMMLQFQPKDGNVWDVIPYYHDGMYHALFLISGLDKPEWGHAVSRDLLLWQELPVAIKACRTGPDQDGCITGSVIYAKGTYWMFYTGQNFVKSDRVRVRDQHRKTQPTTICLATSTDALHWEKHPGNPICPQVCLGRLARPARVLVRGREAVLDDHHRPPS
jgi:sucrose-6-phosphate hydrolase SacC (GH32 family)